MFKPLLLGSVLGMTVVVFSSVASMGFDATRLEERLDQDQRLLTLLEKDLAAIEALGGPEFVDRFLDRAISKTEKQIAKIECKLGHCGVSEF